MITMLGASPNLRGSVIPSVGGTEADPTEGTGVDVTEFTWYIRNDSGDIVGYTGSYEGNGNGLTDQFIIATLERSTGTVTISGESEIPSDLTDKLVLASVEYGSHNWISNISVYHHGDYYDIGVGATVLEHSFYENTEQGGEHTDIDTEYLKTLQVLSWNGNTQKFVNRVPLNTAALVYSNTVSGDTVAVNGFTWTRHSANGTSTVDIPSLANFSALCIWAEVTVDSSGNLDSGEIKHGDSFPAQSINVLRIAKLTRVLAKVDTIYYYHIGDYTDFQPTELPDPDHSFYKNPSQGGEHDDIAVVLPRALQVVNWDAHFQRFKNDNPINGPAVTFVDATNSTTVGVEAFTWTRFTESSSSNINVPAQSGLTGPCIWAEATTDSNGDLTAVTVHQGSDFPAISKDVLRLSKVTVTNGAVSKIEIYQIGDYEDYDISIPDPDHSFYENTEQGGEHTGIEVSGLNGLQVLHWDAPSQKFKNSVPIKGPAVTFVDAPDSSTAGFEAFSWTRFTDSSSSTTNIPAQSGLDGPCIWVEVTVDSDDAITGYTVNQGSAFPAISKNILRISKITKVSSKISEIEIYHIGDYTDYTVNDGAVDHSFYANTTQGGEHTGIEVSNIRPLQVIRWDSVNQQFINSHPLIGPGIVRPESDTLAHWDAFTWYRYDKMGNSSIDIYAGSLNGPCMWISASVDSDEKLIGYNLGQGTSFPAHSKNILRLARVQYQSNTIVGIEIFHVGDYVDYILRNEYLTVDMTSPIDMKDANDNNVAYNGVYRTQISHRKVTLQPPSDGLASVKTFTVDDYGHVITFEDENGNTEPGGPGSSDPEDEKCDQNHGPGDDDPGGINDDGDIGPGDSDDGTSGPGDGSGDGTNDDGTSGPGDEDCYTTVPTQPE